MDSIIDFVLKGIDALGAPGLTALFMIPVVIFLAPIIEKNDNDEGDGN